MGYLFLTMALAAGLVKGYCGKKMGSYAMGITAPVLLNLIRMVLCAFFGGILLLVCGDAPALSFSTDVLLISALSGTCTSFFVVSWLISVKKSAYMMLDVFLMLGTLVPMVLGRIFFSEHIGLNDAVGFAVLIVAVVIMCSYNNGIKAKLTPGSLLLLILCGVANGIVDFSQKMFVKKLPDTPVSVFNFYTYIFAALTLLLFFLALRRKETPRFEEDAPKCRYLYVAIMAAALITYSLFKTKAAVYLESAVLYPLSQSLALVFSTLMAATFFEEKLTVKAVIGITLSFVGLIVMNFL